MGKVSLDRMEIVYEYAKKVREESVRIDKAIQNIAEETEMDESSAKIMVKTIIQMLNGDDYTWAISAEGTKLLLDSILRDFDEAKVKEVITLVRRHMRLKRNGKKGSYENLGAVLYDFEKAHGMKK